MINLPASEWVQFALFFVVLFGLAGPLGLYMARVYEGEKHILLPVLGWLEKLFYKGGGIKSDDEMDWKQYAQCAILLSAVSFFGLYALLRLQALLPLNPAGMGEISDHLSFNTAVSFITNTNWQSYGGEATMSYLSQMLGLGVQNFLSAASGMAVLVALVRGFVRKNSKTIGNFWVDVTRSTIYILLPLSCILALLLVGQGVVQTFSPYAEVQLLEPIAGADNNVVTTQTIAVGPAASQIAIKQLGTNGGGFFNVNSAHPLENPTPFSNFMEMISILLIPAALCVTFGRMVGDVRQGVAVLVAMTIIFVPLTLFCLQQELNGNQHFKELGVADTVNMEGKETRNGVMNSVIWATATTAASNGSVNSMHASYTPLGGMVPMILMQFGEVIYGGVGSGLYGMLVFVLLTVFIAGLMVGRTPEYLGKKVQAFEIKMASVAILVPPLFALGGAAIAVLLEAGKAGILNPGAQGFSEVLYAFTSAANNNGSAFAGLTANAPFYDTAMGLAMLFGRFWVMLPVLAIAGSLAAKNTVPPSAGTLPTHTPLFVGFLVGVVVMVGVLTYVPSLALGPIAEHFVMLGK
ncbi:MAG: potassium-transporting ATPase subunit KdpA [Pseudobdellovibrionaceae bacterium]